jgi:hypothetical protein
MDMGGNESREQGQSGQRGAESHGNEGSGGQVRQGSGRVEAPKVDEPKHHFEEGHAPSEQGDRSSPGPEQIAQNQQGFAGTGGGKSGSSAGSERSEEQAQRGAPSEGHTRAGRQNLSGDRAPE